MSTRGQHLVASPSLNDPNFEFTVVFMLEHSDEGALGVVLTRPSELPVTDMFDGWVDHAAAPSVVFRGGPVSLSSVIALQGVRLFAGYASWAPGQLDAELVDDAWIVLDAAETDLLHPEPAELWWIVVGRQRSDIRLLANYPSELWVN